MAGCSNQKKDAYTMGEWIQKIVNDSEIQGYREEKPYFLNITTTNPYFSSVQAAVEWGILSTEYSFDSEELLTVDMAAYTMMNYLGFDNSSVDRSIRDINQSKFSEHITSAKAFGLFQLDEKDRIYPKKVLTIVEADQLWDEVLNFSNHVSYESSINTIQWITSENTFVEPIVFNFESGTIILSEKLEDNSRITGTFQNQQFYGTVRERVKVEEGYMYQFEQGDYSEWVEDMEVGGESELDFSQAVLLPSAYVWDKEIGNNGNEKVISMKVRDYSNSFDLNGYAVQIRLNANGLSAELSRTLKGGMEFSADFSLSGLKPTYYWKSSKGTIEHAYVRFDFVAKQGIAVSHEAENRFHEEYSALVPSDAVNKLISLFGNEREEAEIRIPLCTIQIPIPNAAPLNVGVHVDLLIGVNGCARLEIAEKCGTGMEIRNGNVRLIHDVVPTCEAALEANAKAEAQLMLSLGLGNMMLADVAVGSGSEITYKSVFHIYEKNDYQVLESDIPGDYADPRLSTNGNVLVCGNISNNGFLDLHVNSSKTVCGRLGCSVNKRILEGSFPLGENFGGHYENGMKVSQCTRSARKPTNKSEEAIVSDSLRINTYHVILNVNESYQIHILEVPSGYTKSDLLFSSEDATVATVSSNGIISGKKSGSAIISISTTDRKYQIRCTVLIRAEVSV